MKKTSTHSCVSIGLCGAVYGTREDASPACATVSLSRARVIGTISALISKAIGSLSLRRMNQPWMFLTCGQTSTSIPHWVQGTPQRPAFPELKKIIVVDGEASEIKIFDYDTYKLIGRTELTIDADPAVYDPARNIFMS